ncbi:hypothetical protein GCM10022403_087720 [Streptomyces coacervatus]|uniref:Uncharacterized protein n=1 Tax=Streptomyces coacervatus TaxID=647381 RepID=A0ABP7JDB1_9ACTN|nr:hypothetical protein [Streptomyces coacervatus]MDF2273455.1 hypothetical protein [Streptomyces coacervatus]
MRGLPRHDVCKPVALLAVVVSGLLTAAHLLLGVEEFGRWSLVMLLWGCAQAGIAPLQLWLRQFYATAHERSRLGLRYTALRQATGPIFTAADFAACTGDR